MADKKISALAAATVPLAGTEVLPIVQSGTTVKVSVNNLTAGKNVGTARLFVTSAVETAFSPNIYNVSVTGTSAPTSGTAGGGIVFRGYFTGTTAADFAFVSGIKENAVDGDYGGALVLGTRPNGSGGGSMESMRLDSLRNVQIGTGAIATNATNGFFYIPTCAGTPTGTPTTKTGLAPMVVDSANNKLYVYIGGAWQAMN